MVEPGHSISSAATSFFELRRHDAAFSEAVTGRRRRPVAAIQNRTQKSEFRKLEEKT
jgi:hypothetical protein